MLDRPDISTRPIRPITASTLPAPLIAGGKAPGSICEMDANRLLGISMRSRPIKNTYHSTTSQKKSRYFLSLTRRYPLIPSPVKRWIRPKAIENRRSFIGSFKGTNHKAFISPPSGTLTWKKVSATTSIASPKYPPKRIPQINVDNPPYINNFNDFRMELSILGNFFTRMKQTRNTRIP